MIRSPSRREHAAPEAPAVVHVPALGEVPRPVGEGVLHRVVVEELVVRGPDLAASLALGRDRPGAFRPAGHVEVVDQPVEEKLRQPG